MPELPIATVLTSDKRPVHMSITPEQIIELVDTFYGRIHDDARLGPIFARHITGDWPDHLAKMKGFWRSVLLKTGEYHGRPVPAHIKITDLSTDDFHHWLELFRQTVDEIFEPGARPLVVTAAERIASSLWLAINPTLYSEQPDWRVDAGSER
jgi:hemoglobin